MTGDLTVPNLITAGNVDGRDVSVDGAKLDGIEAGADVTDATNVAAAGAVMDGDFTVNGLMVRTGAGAYSTVTDNSTNWNTAYGWGNHASAGYLTGITGQSIQNLSDVTTMTPTDGQVLVWNATGGYWGSGNAPAPSASALLASIETVDGAGSGLDADLLDGQHGSFYAPLASPTFTGTVSAPAIRANSITNSAGTGAPDFPNGFTVNGQVPVTNESQILLNRPAANNYYLNDGGVYIANFSAGTATVDMTAGSSSVSFNLVSSVIPTMSGGTTSTCSSGSVVCTVSPAGASNLSALFDRGVTYFAQYTSSTMTVTVDMGVATPITSYILDRFVNSTYQPRTWNFQGSTNNSTWVTLDSYSSTADWGGERLTRSVSATYRYYRWAFTANNGNPSPTGYVIDDIYLIGGTPTPSTYTSETFTAGSAPIIATIKARVNASSAPVSGSTLTLYASRDNGTTWTTVPFTVTPPNYFSDNRHFISGSVDISGQPSGTQMKYKLEAVIGDFTSIDAVVMEWE